MFRCRIVDFFFHLAPLKRWQSFLVSLHIQKCKLCQAKLASTEEVKSFLVQEKEFENLESLWPAVSKKISEKGKEQKIFLRPRWKWAIGAASLLAVITIGILIFYVSNSVPRSSVENMVEGFRINYIRVGDRPAEAFLYQTQDSDFIMVWAEKNI